MIPSADRLVPRSPAAVRRLAALALFLAAAAVLAAGARSVGIARDEGVYMEAGRRYGAWVVEVMRAPAKAMETRDRVFAFNWEHPDLLKTAFGLSARLLARPPADGTASPEDPGGLLPVLPESAAMRLPAQLAAAAGVALLFLAAAQWFSPAAGLVAAGSLLLAPRFHFHAHLAAFDVPVTVAIFATCMAYLRALRRPRALPWFVIAFGLAIGCKLNALFVGPLLYAHHLGRLALHRRAGGRLRWRHLVPAWAVAGALGSPLVALATWPWLWPDPVGRFAAFARFHAAHPWYNMEFLGRNHNLPPLPPTYPFVLHLATVPTTTVVLALVGFVLWVGADLRRRSNDDPRPVRVASATTGPPRAEGLLCLIFALFPLLLIAWPTVPIFGGTKHFLPALPFWALAAGAAFHALSRGLRPALRGALAALAILPSGITTATGHPQGLSQYVAFVGGARGAARLGLGRGFWGHAVVPLLEHLPAQGRVHLHDLHPLARRQYLREGRWPPGLVPSGPSRADVAFYFEERHMRADETRIWSGLRTRRPTAVLDLHDVPLTLRYDRPRRAP